MANNPGTYAEIDCNVIRHTEAEEAILIDPVGNFEESDYKWVPKSLFDPDEDLPEDGEEVIYIARWFAQKEGLI